MFKPKMINSLPYIALEYFNSKPKIFIKVSDEYFELSNEANEIERKIYDYFFNEQKNININDIQNELKK